LLLLKLKSFLPFSPHPIIALWRGLEQPNIFQVYGHLYWLKVICNKENVYFVEVAKNANGSLFYAARDIDYNR